MLLAAHLLAQTPSAAPESFRVAGSIVNAITGDPVRGAMLSLIPHDGTTPQATTRSDEEGRFRFSAIPAGKYQLLATRRGYARALYEQHGDYNSAVIVAAGQDTEHLLFRLPPMASIHGTLLGDGGDAVEGARLQIFRKPGIDEPEGHIYQAAQTVTDDRGAFEFTNLFPGEYLLAATAQPWWAMHSASRDEQPPAELDVAYPVTYYASTTDEASATPIRLTPGARIDASFSVHAVPAVRVTLRQHAEGEQTPPASLRQYLFGIEFEPENTISQNHDPARGETEFTGLAPGHYQISSGLPAHVLSLDAVSNATVEDATGTAAANLSGTLETAPGVLYDQLAGLELLPEGGTQPRAIALVKDGKFSFEELPAGNWTVKIRNGYGHGLQVHSIAIAGKKIQGNRFSTTGQALEITIRATQGATNLTGIALKDGKPVPGAMMVLVPNQMENYPAMARRDQTDSDGSFNLLNVVAGDYTVVAIENGWDLDWSQMEVIARYLPHGQSVRVPVGSSGNQRLDQPVAVQPR